MKHTIRLDIPASVPSLNKLLRMHWSARRKVRESWEWMIRVAILDGRINRVTFPRARVTIQRSGARRFDFDNFVGGAKETILDSLVRERFLLDDSPDHVTVEYIQHCGKPHTTISIEEAVA